MSVPDDFFGGNDTNTRECDVCQATDDLIGRGSVNVHTGRHTYHLCPACAAEEDAQIANRTQSVRCNSDDEMDDQ